MTDHDTRTPSGRRPVHGDRSRPTGGGRVLWAVGAACLVCCLAPLLAAAGVWAGTVTVAGLWRAAAGMVTAQAQFRRVRGYWQLPALARALEQAVGYQPDASDIPHAARA